MTRRGTTYTLVCPEKRLSLHTMPVMNHPVVGNVSYVVFRHRGLGAGSVVALIVSIRRSIRVAWRAK